MYLYSMTQWVFFFYFYCFLGWCFESTYVSIKNQKITNRGFMRGPFLPLYGSGAMMMLIVSAPYADNVFLTFISGMIGATVLEYVTGIAMEGLFKVRYWDYSTQPFNFQGQICLGSSIAWGFLTIAMTRLLHRPIEQIVLAIPGNILSILTYILTIYIVVDFTLAFKTALDMKDILLKMEKAKDELEKIQRRLDVMIAIADEDKANRKQEREIRMDELTANIELKLTTLKKMMQEKPGEYLDSAKDEVSELLVRFGVEKQKRLELTKLKNVYRKAMMLGNPDMISKRFGETFEELRTIITTKIKGNENDK